MTDHPSELRIDRRALLRGLGVAGAALPLAACGGRLDYLSGEVFGPKITIDATRPYTAVDPGRAAAIINAYRARSGARPLAVDGTLNSIAAAYARAMASVDKMSHALSPWGPLDKRLRAGGYAYASAGENLGVGYRNIDDAFEGWRTSSAHDAIMRDASKTHMGIASVYRPDSGWKTFWCMIVARPRGAEAAGERVGPFGSVL